jgi:hypothetical protein
MDLRRRGGANSILSSEKWTLGWRILEKAKNEYLVSSDYSTSIVFSAMAFEAELARLYFKWRRIDTMRSGRVPADEEFDEEYRQLGRTIAERSRGSPSYSTHAGSTTSRASRSWRNGSRPATQP